MSYLPASWAANIWEPLVAEASVTCRPSAANSPRCCATYKPALSSVGTVATVRSGFSTPVAVADPPPLAHAATSEAAAAIAPTTGSRLNRRIMTNPPIYPPHPEERINQELPENLLLCPNSVSAADGTANRRHLPGSADRKGRGASSPRGLTVSGGRRNDHPHSPSRARMRS